MDLREFMLMARQEFQKHHVTDWSLGFDNSVRRFGVTRYKLRKVTFSRQLVELNSEDTCRDTVLHELAHVIAKQRHPHVRVGHSDLWKAVAVEVGAKPERCFGDDVETPPARYTADCANPNCSTTFSRNRWYNKPDHWMAGLRCRVCRTPIIEWMDNETGSVKWRGLVTPTGPAIS